MKTKSLCMKYLKGTLLSGICLGLLIPFAGCSRKKGMSDYEQKIYNQGVTSERLQELGAKVTEKTNPQGASWSINLEGIEITDEIWKLLKKVGYITELNLSKTNVTDSDMAKVNESEICGVLRKLDLSHTSVTDDGLMKLDRMILLGEVNLAGSKVTPSGADRWKQRRISDPKIMQGFKKPVVKLK